MSLVEFLQLAFFCQVLWLAVMLPELISDYFRIRRAGREKRE